MILKNTLSQHTFNKFIFFWGLGLLFSCSISAEEEFFATGFVPTKREIYTTIPKATRHRAFHPAAYDISNKFPQPGNQGKQGSCVAWATTYATRSYHEALKQDWDPNTLDHQFSPAFVYNQIKLGGCDSGSNFKVALDFLKNVGTVSINQFPYNKNECSKKPDAALLDSAANFKIDDYQRVDEQKLDDIKGQIYASNPVIIGMSLSKDFTKLRGDQIYDNRNPNEDNYGGHAMVLVAYDDAKQAFKLMNSWGTQSWGNNGFGWISYAAFEKRVQEAYVIKVANTKPLPIQQKFAPDLSVEQKIKEVTSAVSCAKLNAVITNDNTINLSGFAGNRSDVTQLVSDLKSLDLQISENIDVKPWPQCEVLLSFQDVLAKKSGLTLTIAGQNKADLQKGEKLTIEVTTPSYPTYVYVTYIAANGDVIHLEQPNLNNPKPLKANTKLIFGDGKNGRDLFTVSAPFGNEIIVAIATTQPLFSAPLPQPETERDYLTQFQGAFLTRATQVQQSISAAVATLLTYE